MNSETAQPPTTFRHFTILLSATPRGARLARRLAVQQLIEWERPFETAEQIVAELANNAALHGRVPGRNFRTTLRLSGAGTLRIEVTDTCPERLPRTAQLARAGAESESGRGLLLVETLADRWGTEVGPAPRKTVWAELDFPWLPPASLAPQARQRETR
ncbi:ATP-binding protein [Actinomycetota bacterium Odt1-20B]